MYIEEYKCLLCTSAGGTVMQCTSCPNQQVGMPCDKTIKINLVKEMGSIKPKSPLMMI